MNDLHDVKVGDTLLLTEDRRGGPLEVQVTRVGRTLLYVKRYGQEVAFYRDSGWERRSPNAGGLGALVRTPQQIAEAGERASLERELHELGLSVSRWNGRQWTLDQLRRLLLIAQEDKP